MGILNILSPMCAPLILTTNDDPNAMLRLAENVDINADSVLSANGVTCIGGVHALSLQGRSNMTLTLRSPLEQFNVMDSGPSTAPSNITIHNEFVGNKAIDITLGENANLQIDGTELTIGDITIAQGSTMHWSYQGRNLQITAPDDHSIAIPDVTTVSNALQFVHSVNQGEAISRTMYKKCKQYQSVDHNDLKILAKQNGIEFKEANIDTFVNQHFLEFNEVCKDGTQLTGSTDILGHCTSFLNIDDVFHKDVAHELLSNQVSSEIDESGTVGTLGADAIAEMITDFTV